MEASSISLVSVSGKVVCSYCSSLLKDARVSFSPPLRSTCRERTSIRINFNLLFFFFNILQCLKSLVFSSLSLILSSTDKSEHTSYSASRVHIFLHVKLYSFLCPPIWICLFFSCQYLPCKVISFPNGHCPKKFKSLWNPVIFPKVL